MKLSANARHLIAVLRVVLGLVLLVYVLTRSDVRSALGPILLTYWIAPLLLLATAYGATVEALRLRVMFRAQDISVTLPVAYRVVAIATFFNFCIPGGTGGDVVKLYYLAAANRTRGVEVATVLVVDRAMGLTALLLFLLGMVAVNAAVVLADPVLRSLAGVAAIGLVVVALAFSMAWSARLRASRAYTFLLRLLPLRRYAERAADAVYRFRGHRKAVAAALGLSLLGHLGVAATFVALASVALPDAPPLLVALLSMMGMVANALPITPGGIGVGEAAFAQLFQLVGYSGAAVLMLGWRVALLPLATVGALLYITGGGRTRASSAAVESRESAAAVDHVASAVPARGGGALRKAGR